MKCPNCGEYLKRSMKNPNYGLCYHCKKKFRLTNNERQASDLLDNSAKAIYVENPHSKPKKKKGCGMILLIVVGVFIAFVAVCCIVAIPKSKNKTDKAEVSVSATKNSTGTFKSKEENTGDSTEDNKEDDVSIEYENALTQAKMYNQNLSLSKDGLFRQLTSEYGGQFSEDAANYAIEHLDADYKQAALEKAKSYQGGLSMSKDAIYDQLVSDAEGFTKEEAQYAIEHLE